MHQVYFSTNCTIRFNTSVENLPPLQLVQLWKQVAESLFSDYITPVLMQEASINYLHAVNLFCEFIEHVKITEANVNQINGLVEDNFSMMVAPLLITIIDSTKSGLKYVIVNNISAILISLMQTKRCGCLRHAVDVLLTDATGYIHQVPIQWLAGPHRVINCTAVIL